MEIQYKKVLAQIKSLVSENIVEEVGANRWIQYRLNSLIINHTPMAN